MTYKWTAQDCWQFIKLLGYSFCRTVTSKAKDAARATGTFLGVWK